ncbi:MAG: hypothetical protein QOF74_9247 [Caballeronia mineralivorans]|jgi:hypothetical protein|nr:hypothetical protein [Caballeronia mineralivorans]
MSSGSTGAGRGALPTEARVASEAAAVADNPLPRLLRWWMLLEHRLYRTPVPSIKTADNLPPFMAVLYDGDTNIHALCSALLHGRSPVMQVIYQPAGSGEALVLAESRIAIPDKNFFCLSIALCLQRRSSLIERALDRMNDSIWLDQFAIAEPPANGCELSSATVLHFAARHVARMVLNQGTKRIFRRHHWAMWYRKTSTNSTAAQRTEWLAIPAADDRFYADPFLWKDPQGVKHLFFEELPYDTNKGVISHVSFDTVLNGWTQATRVLERSYHLSYPFIFSFDASVYMIPESSANNTIEVYRAVRFPFEWTLHAVMMRDVTAVDTTLHYDGKTWWLFTSMADKGGSNWDELSIFYADDPFGEWTPHPMNPVVSDCSTARMAGNLFTDHENRLIRPAQDCEREYGAAIRFNEVVVLSKTAYEERVVSTELPARGYTGRHTWNECGEFSVTDQKLDVLRWGPRRYPHQPRK